MNILLIEGDVIVREALGQALASENYRVVHAGNRQEALREFQSQPFDQPIDLVLLDLNPRNENAFETVQRLTALQPDLPVVAMTARLEQHDSTAGAPVLHALMAKPLNLQVLMKTLKDLTSQPPEPQRRCHSRLRPNGTPSSHYE
jgi:DNA-binding response OmpR family regulator